jgi:peptide/nickel transport system substrate-binding protein
VATLKRQAAASGGLSRLWTLLAGVEATDPQTVTIRLKEPVGPFLRNISLLQIVPSEAAAAAGKDYGAAVRLPGTGPFRVKEFRPGQLLELEANRSYWDRPPQIDGVRFLSIPELSGRVTALINNEIDVTWSIPDDQIEVLKKSPNVKIETAPSVIYLYSWFNSSRKPFNDARVRRALWHAIDIERVVADLLPQTGKVARAPIASTVFGYAPQKPYSYDPKLAKQLLAEAGYPNGLKAEIKYSVNFGSSIDQVAQTFAAYWQEIGVDIKPTQLEHAVFTADLRSLKWDMIIATNPTYTEDADYTLGRLYSSPNGVNEENGYVNPKLHDLLMAARTEVNQERRAALYAEAGGIIWNDAVGIFPAELVAVYASRSNVSGLDPAPTMAPRLRNVTLK